MSQLKEAAKIADAKYPREDGWRIVWIFDHSSCHAAMPDDALDVSKMNVNPGVKQQVMRDGWWGGKPQNRLFSWCSETSAGGERSESGTNVHSSRQSS